MVIIDRYISASIIKGCILMLVILLSVFSFMELVQQLDDVGKGNFQTADAFKYILLNLPARMLEIAPIATLIGSIAALGLLNKNSELIAIRASGVSIGQISISILKTGIALMLVMALVSEFVAPRAQQYAEGQRMLAVSMTGDLLKDNGYWSRDGNSYLNIKSLMHGRIPTDISIYTFDKAGNLRFYTHAEHADISNKKLWKLQDVVRKTFSTSGVTSVQLEEMPWRPFSSLTQLGRLELPVYSLSPYNLYKYIEYLDNAGQNTQRYQIMLWQKIMGPISLVALMLLALPFAFGALRSASFSLRIVLGIITGLVYTLFNQFMGNLGLLFNINALLTAATPVVLVTIACVYLLRRAR